MEAPEWSKITASLTCQSESLPQSVLDPYSYFAVAYHSITSIRSRCYKNVGVTAADLLSYAGEAIVSSRTSSGHQLAVKLSIAKDGQIEIIICSDNPEESPHYLAEYLEKIKGLTERIGKMDEKQKKRVIGVAKVEMILDTVIDKVLSRALAGAIYPNIGLVRENLIRTLEGFDPIHIETGEVMENLHSHPQDTTLGDEKTKLVCIRLLDWRKKLSKMVDELPPPPK